MCFPSSEYFGADTVLALRMRGSGDVFEVLPQKSDHEMIIGRSSSGSAIMPDGAVGLIVDIAGLVSLAQEEAQGQVAAVHGGGR